MKKTRLSAGRRMGCSIEIEDLFADFSQLKLCFFLIAQGFDRRHSLTSDLEDCWVNFHPDIVETHLKASHADGSRSHKWIEDRSLHDTEQPPHQLNRFAGNVVFYARDRHPKYARSDRAKQRSGTVGPPSYKLRLVPISPKLRPGALSFVPRYNASPNPSGTLNSVGGDG